MMLIIMLFFTDVAVIDLYTYLHCHALHDALLNSEKIQKVMADLGLAQ